MKTTITFLPQGSRRYTESTETLYHMESQKVIHTFSVSFVLLSVNSVVKH